MENGPLALSVTLIVKLVFSLNQRSNGLKSFVELREDCGVVIDYSRFCFAFS